MRNKTSLFANEFLQDINISSEGKQHDVDMKLFMKVANEQFWKMNVRLDEYNPRLSLSPLEDE